MKKCCEGLGSTEPRDGGVASGQATGRESAHDTEARCDRRSASVEAMGRIQLPRKHRSKAGIVPGGKKHGEPQRVCGEGGHAVGGTGKRRFVFTRLDEP